MSGGDFSRLRTLTARRLHQALLQDGFAAVRQRGSHHRYAHPDGRRVTLAYSSPGDTFRRATLHDIIYLQAEWTAADLRRLGLLR